MGRPGARLGGWTGPEWFDEAPHVPAGHTAAWKTLATGDPRVNDRRKILIESTPESAIHLVATLVSGIACEAVAQRGRFSLALAGGTTPYQLYQDLTSPQSLEQIPWQHTFIFFGDERDVPHDHADSNYRMAEETLLRAVPMPFQQVFPMPADSTDLDQAARQYAQTVIQEVPAGPNGVPAFDLILLGMGGDGHTASLFPGTPALEESQKLIVTQHVPMLGRNRMTFTYPLINAAHNVVFLVTGMDKAEVIQRVLSDDPQVAAQLPAGRVRPQGTLYLVLDAEAGSRVHAKAAQGG